MKPIAAAALLLTLAGTLAASNHMPVALGNSWEFAFRDFSGGWGMSRVDSGTVNWRVSSVEHLESYPVLTRVTIVQTTTTIRRMSNGGVWASDTLDNGYDSILDPPRVLVDTLTLESLEGVNGWWWQGDTCWSFVVDPGIEDTTGRAGVVDTVAVYNGDTLDAADVHSEMCGGGEVVTYSCAEPTYFTTVDGIGPVAFHHRSSPCLMDAYWGSDWELLSVNDPSDAGVVRRSGPRASKRFSLGVSAGGAVTVVASAPLTLAVVVYGIDGSTVGPSMRLWQCPDGVNALHLPRGLADGAYVVTVGEHGRSERQSVRILRAGGVYR